MHQAIVFSVLFCGAVLAALAASAGMAGAVHVTSRRPHGYMHLVFYAILLLVALDNLLSGRDWSVDPYGVAESLGAPARHPLMVWVQPLVSLLILAVTGERILTHWIAPQTRQKVPVLLLSVFLFYWACTVAAPALFGAHPYLSHDYVYPVVIGVAVLLASGTERDLAFRAARDALFVFMAAGLLLVPVNPGLVMDVAYNQGLFPGVPRLSGLASHPVSLGVLTQLGLICLLACPYRSRWLNVAAWATGFLILFLAQSKTAWISFVLCSACILAARRGPAFMRRVGDPARNDLGIVIVLGFMAAVLAAACIVMFGDLGHKLSNFFDSSQGAQLTSLTGRDLIWAIAQDEWLRNPVFGYGPTLWDAEFRAAIGMPNATSAHNQFMDTLSRSGTVGATALVLYALVLMVMSVKYTRASGGLTLALFLALALRSVSEVPLMLFGYGPELITHMLLLMTLAAAMSAARVPGVTRRHMAATRAPSTERFGAVRPLS
ncbi:MAG: O-antigen ligase protein [Polaromonas sp.]|nr:O-antigen ligase protein [Polaromonas sp.]